MDDLEEFESWHDDLMAWERHQDELERINSELYILEELEKEEDSFEEKESH